MTSFPFVLAFCLLLRSNTAVSYNGHHDLWAANTPSGPQPQGACADIIGVKNRDLANLKAKPKGTHDSCIFGVDEKPLAALFDDCFCFAYTVVGVRTSSSTVSMCQRAGTPDFCVFLPFGFPFFNKH